MASKQEMVDALRAKSFDFKRWIDGGRDVGPSIIEHPCPMCGGQLICAYANMGATDIYDTFAHVCLNPACKYATDETLFSSSDDGPRPDCPLCAALKEKKEGE